MLTSKQGQSGVNENVEALGVGTVERYTDLLL